MSLISGIEKFVLEVMSRFSIGNWSSQITEKLRSGTLLCFIKILVSKKFMDKKEGGSKGGSEEGREGRREGGREGGS